MLKSISLRLVTLFGLSFLPQIAIADTTIYGPKQTFAPLLGTKTQTATFQAAGAPVSGSLIVKNGSGDDLSEKSCVGLALVPKIVCVATNVINMARLAIERPSSVEVSVNGTTVVRPADLPRTTNSLIVPISLMASNTITLKIKGSILSSVTLEMQTRAQAPAASLRLASAGTGFTPLIVEFDTSLSTDPNGDLLTYDYNFGDGETLTTTATLVSHEFRSAGRFTVEVTARDPGGLSSKASIQVETVAPILPIARIVADRTDIFIGEPIHFSGLTSEAMNPGATIATYE